MVFLGWFKQILGDQIWMSKFPHKRQRRGSNFPVLFPKHEPTSILVSFRGNTGCSEPQINPQGLSSGTGSFGLPFPGTGHGWSQGSVRIALDLLWTHFLWCILPRDARSF